MDKLTIVYAIDGLPYLQVLDGLRSIADEKVHKVL